MTDHTPTPWRTDDGWALGVYDVVGPDDKPICMVAHGDIDHDLRILNAAFIVKAVNNFEPMVAELRRLFELYGHQATADVLRAVVGGVKEL